MRTSCLERLPIHTLMHVCAPSPQLHNPEYQLLELTIQASHGYVAYLADSIDDNTAGTTITSGDITDDVDMTRVRVISAGGPKGVNLTMVGTNTHTHTRD